MYEVKQHGWAWGVFHDGKLLQMADTEDDAQLIATRYELMDEHLSAGWKRGSKNGSDD